MIAISVPVEIVAPPPVPPRRRRRKIRDDRVVDEPPMTAAATRSIIDEHGTSSASSGLARPERKSRSLPPPPPVPRSLVPRRKKSRSAVDSNSDPTSHEPKPLIRAITDGTAKPRFVVTKVTDIDDYETQRHDRHPAVTPELGNENISGGSSPMPRTSSPLFFTFRDFEAVMEHSGKSDRGVDRRFDSIVINDHPDPAEESEEDEKVFFGVTTTSVPFEKCLDSRDSGYDYRDFGRNFNEINYIFEDYTDRGERSNRRASAASLFDDGTFDDSMDKNEPDRRTLRSATRVRFVLESPTRSIPDLDVDDTRDDPRKVDSVVMTEIRNDRGDESPNSDEFGDVPFSSLIEGNPLIRDPFESSGNNFHSLRYFEPNERKNDAEIESRDERDSTNLRNHNGDQRRPRSTPSPRFAGPRKLSIEPIPDITEILLPDLPTTHDPRDEGYVNKEQWDSESEADCKSAKSINDGSSFLETSWNRSIIGESGGAAPREALARGKPKSSSRETSNHDSRLNDDSTRIGVESNANANHKISMDSALGNVLNQDDDDDVDRRETSDEEDANIDIGGEKRNRSILSENSWLFADTEDKVDRGLPVNLRRDSFLENTLIDEDNDDRRSFADDGCSMIAARPKSASPREPIVPPPLDIPEEITEESSGSLIDVHGDGESRETSRKQLANQERRKSTVEAKSDALLNELLRNFTAKRLKLAEPLARRPDDTKMNETAEFVPGTEEPEFEERIAEASEGIKVVDGAEKRTPSVGIEFKEAASIDFVDLRLDDADDFLASTESKEATMTNKLESEEADSLDIVPSDDTEETDENLTIRRIDESAIVVIECTEDGFVTMRRCDKDIGIDSRASSLDVARTSDKSDTIISADKCAVVGNIDNGDERFNDNDNNAMTPVELSNDQKSRHDDVSAIIAAPGSVGSFVESCEIQRDRTTIERRSKINDSVTSTASSTGTISNGETWIADAYDSTLIEDKEESGVAEFRFNKIMADGRSFAKDRDLDEIVIEDRGTEDSSTRFKNQDHDDAIEDRANVRDGELRRNDDGRSGAANASVRLREASSNIPVAAERRLRESKSLRRFDEHGSSRNESNKFVGTFYNDCDATMMDGNDHGARNVERSKRRAPERPERPVRTRDGTVLPDFTMRKTVEVVGDRGSMESERLLEIGERSNPTPSPRSNVTLIRRPQIHQHNIQDEKKNRDNVKSGIASSALDTDVPQLREPCVFYRRV